MLERAAHPCHIEGACVGVSSPFIQSPPVLLGASDGVDSRVINIEGLVVPTTVKIRDKA